MRNTCFFPGLLLSMEKILHHLLPCAVGPRKRGILGMRQGARWQPAITSDYNPEFSFFMSFRVAVNSAFDVFMVRGVSENQSSEQGCLRRRNIYLIKHIYAIPIPNRPPHYCYMFPLFYNISQGECLRDVFALMGLAFREQTEGPYYGQLTPTLNPKPNPNK